MNDKYLQKNNQGSFKVHTWTYLTASLIMRTLETGYMVFFSYFFHFSAMADFFHIPYVDTVAPDQPMYSCRLI